MALALLLSLLHEEELEERASRRILRSIRDTSDPFTLADDAFIGLFRLPKEACRYLLETLKPFDEQETSLPFVVRFFDCLHFFGNGKLRRSLANNSTAPMIQSSSVEYISSLITKHLSSMISFPESDGAQLGIKARFFIKFGIKSTIGAVNCTNIKLVCPLSNPTTKRRLHFSIHVEVVSDDNLRILALNPVFPGDERDAFMWENSPVRKFMRTTKGTWLLGNEAYPLEPWLMTPMSYEETSKQKRYNRIVLKAHSVVNQCISLLKSRFRCLLKNRPLAYKPENATMIINACAILHNIMIVKYPQYIMEVGETEHHVDCHAPLRYGELFEKGEKIRQNIIKQI